MLANGVKVQLVVAMGLHREIGQGGKMPWDIPSEMRFFYTSTKNTPLVMGANTAISLGDALKGRPNFVIAGRDSGELIEKGFIVFPTLEACLQAASHFAERGETHTVSVIGGARTYAAAIPYADSVLISRIYHEFPHADTYFPELPDDFAKILEGSLDEGDRSEPQWDFVRFMRRESHPAKSV